MQLCMHVNVYYTCMTTYEYTRIRMIIYLICTVVHVRSYTYRLEVLFCYVCTRGVRSRKKLTQPDPKKFKKNPNPIRTRILLANPTRTRTRNLPKKTEPEPNPNREHAFSCSRCDPGFWEWHALHVLASMGTYQTRASTLTGILTS